MTKDFAIGLSRALGIWLLLTFAVRTVNSLMGLSRQMWPSLDSPDLVALTWISTLVPCCLYGLLAVVVLVKKKAFVPPSARTVPLDREAAADYLKISLLGVGCLQLYAAYRAMMPTVITRAKPEPFELRIQLPILYIVSAVAFFIIVLWPRNSLSKLLVGRDI